MIVPHDAPPEMCVKRSRAGNERLVPNLCHFARPFPLAGASAASPRLPRLAGRAAPPPLRGHAAGPERCRMPMQRYEFLSSRPMQATCAGLARARCSMGPSQGKRKGNLRVIVRSAGYASRFEPQNKDPPYPTLKANRLRPREPHNCPPSRFDAEPEQDPHTLPSPQLCWARS